MKKLICKRCSYEWYPRKEKLPKFCPKCHNPNWNKPPKNELEAMLWSKRIKKHL